MGSANSVPSYETKRRVPDNLSNEIFIKIAHSDYIPCTD